MKTFFIILLFVSSLQVFSQTKIENTIYKKNIQTVLLYRDGWELSYPIIQLNTDEKLVLSFDEIDSMQSVRKYNLKLIHCNSDWSPSSLDVMEYLNGFNESRINDYQYSFNTFCKYVNYKAMIPNSDFTILKSGNYIVKVYEDFNEENVVLTWRFSVLENLVSVATKIGRPNLVSRLQKGQQVNFKVNCDALQPNFSPDRVTCVVAQNNRHDNAITFAAPKYIQGMDLLYDFEQENIFNAGAEFRYFDAKNIRFFSDRINNIEYIAPYYHFTLIKDDDVSKLVYSYHQDLNGNRLIKLEGSDVSNREADYVFVHFRLNYPVPPLDREVYVFGALTDWKYNDNCKMTYDVNEKMYYLTLFLKQGYYNYQYLVVKNDEKKANETIIEGSSYEAENDYLIYIYYRDFRTNADRLVGLDVANSKKR